MWSCAAEDSGAWEGKRVLFTTPVIFSDILGKMAKHWEESSNLSLARTGEYLEEIQLLSKTERNSRFFLYLDGNSWGKQKVLEVSSPLSRITPHGLAFVRSVLYILAR
jgi:hypothetical protein